MAKTKTIANLKDIFIQSYQWRNTDLSQEKSKKDFRIFSVLNLSILSISIIIALFSKTLSETTLNSILTFTSIFATLIIPVLIMVYDKFVTNPNKNLNEVQQKSRDAKDTLNIHKNFTKRFIFTSLENVFIAITIISIIIIYKSFLNNFFNINIYDYSMTVTFEIENILLFFHVISVIILKTLFIFLLMKFIWFLFYSIGALGDFFKSGLSN